jgi:hypothetical protein
MKTIYKKSPCGQIYAVTNPNIFADWETMKPSEGKAAIYDQVIQRLNHFINAGQTIYTKVEAVSTSGMSRRISLFIVFDGRIVNITSDVGTLTSYKKSDKGGLVVHGAGMDMGFRLIYSLSSIMFNGTVEGDAGYVLKHEWL